jgi:stage III sporulation protein AA
VLICGAPCSGKTTVLRDLARAISTQSSKNVSLIDERGELAATSSGVYQNDVGMCDVFDLYKKSLAMMQAVRSMAPDIIVCDEIGCDEDVTAIEHCLNCGVSIIATVHAANETEIKRKENIKKLVSLGAFEKIAFLSNKKSPGEVVKIVRAGDLFVH